MIRVLRDLKEDYVKSSCTLITLNQLKVKVSHKTENSGPINMTHSNNTKEFTTEKVHGYIVFIGVYVCQEARVLRKLLENGSH